MWDQCGIRSLRGLGCGYHCATSRGKGREGTREEKAPVVAELRWPNLVSNLPQLQLEPYRAAPLPIIPVGLGRT